MRKICLIFTTALMLVLGVLVGAPAASADDGGLTPYINQFRNNSGQPSLATNQQIQEQAQTWASKLAAQDRDVSVDPNVFTPSPAGFEGGTQVPGMGNNGADYLFVEGGLEKTRSAAINDPAWNAIGIGTATSSSGKVYVIVNLATIKIRAAAPAPAPVPIPAPVQPAPAPVLPAPAPAQPEVKPEPVVEPAPVEAPVVPEAEPTATPTATKPSESPTSTPTTAVPSPSDSASLSASPTPEASPVVETISAKPVVDKSPMENTLGATSIISFFAGLLGLRQWLMKFRPRH